MKSRTQKGAVTPHFELPLIALDDRYDIEQFNMILRKLDNAMFIVDSRTALVSPITENMIGTSVPISIMEDATLIGNNLYPILDHYITVNEYQNFSIKIPSGIANMPDITVDSILQVIGYQNGIIEAEEPEEDEIRKPDKIISTKFILFAIALKPANIEIYYNLYDLVLPGQLVYEEWKRMYPNDIKDREMVKYTIHLSDKLSGNIADFIQKLVNASKSYQNFTFLYEDTTNEDEISNWHVEVEKVQLLDEEIRYRVTKTNTAEPYTKLMNIYSSQEERLLLDEWVELTNLLKNEEPSDPDLAEETELKKDWEKESLVITEEAQCDIQVNPYIYYQIEVAPDISELRISLKNSNNDTRILEYKFQIETGNDPITISLPSDIAYEDTSRPGEIPNMVYLITIINGLCSFKKFIKVIEDEPIEIEIEEGFT